MWETVQALAHPCLEPFLPTSDIENPSWRSEGRCLVGRADGS
jgi:hypothetical protein